MQITYIIVVIDQNMQKYEIIQKIGSGAYSQVFKAFDKAARSFVALKKVNHSNRDIALVINRELRILKKFNHPNIVKMLECFDDGIYTYIILEYLQYDLITYYKQVRAKQNRKLRDEEIRRIFYQVCSALAYMHRFSIMHRDIKPENVLVDPDTLLVKIIDFGFSTEYSSWKPNTNYMVTRWYRPPEIVLGLPYDFKADIFSLGALLLELYNGEEVFKSASNFDQLLWVCEVCGYPNWTPVLQKLKEMGIVPNFSKQPHLYQMTRQLTFEAANLIMGMLQPIPQLRMTIQQTLSHRYFTEFASLGRKLHSDNSTNSLHSQTYSSNSNPFNQSVEFPPHLQNSNKRYDSVNTDRQHHGGNHQLTNLHEQNRIEQSNFSYQTPYRISSLHFQQHQSRFAKEPRNSFPDRIIMNQHQSQEKIADRQCKSQKQDILKKRTNSLHGLQITSLKKSKRKIQEQPILPNLKNIENKPIELANGHKTAKLSYPSKLKSAQLKKNPAFTKIRSKILENNISPGFKAKISLSHRPPPEAVPASNDKS